MFIPIVTLAMLMTFKIGVFTTQSANMCAVSEFATALHSATMIIPTAEPIGTFSFIKSFAYFAIPSVMIITPVVHGVVSWFQSVFNKHSPGLLKNDTPGA